MAGVAGPKFKHSCRSNGGRQAAGRALTLVLKDSRNAVLGRIVHYLMHLHTAQAWPSAACETCAQATHPKQGKAGVLRTLKVGEATPRVRVASTPPAKVTLVAPPSIASPTSPEPPIWKAARELPPTPPAHMQGSMHESQLCLRPAAAELAGCRASSGELPIVTSTTRSGAIRL